MPETLPALTAFTPVPRQKQRSNGWKPDIQRAFVEKLADTGSVKAAAKAVGRSPESAYALRRHPEAAEFAAAWEAALDFGIRRIEDTAMDHALNGVEVPVYSYGKLVGKRTVHNDRLLMFMLRNRAPGRFCEGGAKGLNAIGKKQIAKLKQEWEREWMAKDVNQTRTEAQQIVEQIERAHRTWFTNISPAARAAYRTFRRIERATANWRIEQAEPEPPETAEAEYEDIFAHDPRAKIVKQREAAGWFVDEVLEGDTEEKAEEDRRVVARVRTLKDDSW